MSTVITKVYLVDYTDWDEHWIDSVWLTFEEAEARRILLEETTKINDGFGIDERIIGECGG